MIVVETWSDILSLEAHLEPVLYSRLQKRFRTLHQPYCAANTGRLTLSEFSLTDYGAIVLVHSFDEIESISIESAWTISLPNNRSIFIALVPINNGCCKEYWIPYDLMTSDQIEAFKGDYCL